MWSQSHTSLIKICNIIMPEVHVKITIHSYKYISFVQMVFFICFFQRKRRSSSFEYVTDAHYRNARFFFCKLFCCKREPILYTDGIK